MTKRSFLLAAFILALLVAAAPPLFRSPTESRWTVTGAGKPLGTIAVLTDGKSMRAEWKPASPGTTTVFLGGSDKVWVRTIGGDVELASYKGGIEKSLVPTLMLPVMTAASDKVDLKDGKVSSYAFKADAAVKAIYKHDSDGPSQVDVTTGGKTYSLSRSTLGKLTVNDPKMFAVRPRKAAPSQIARLAGDLFGPSDPKVSATAGARGVGRGPGFADGGDYDALVKLEELQQERAARMEQALGEFQNAGKVGPAQEDQ
jgi:hypothetical protein